MTLKVVRQIFAKLREQLARGLDIGPVGAVENQNGGVRLWVHQFARRLVKSRSGKRAGAPKVWIGREVGSAVPGRRVEAALKLGANAPPAVLRPASVLLPRDFKLRFQFRQNRMLERME